MAPRKSTRLPRNSRTLGLYGKVLCGIFILCLAISSNAQESNPVSDQRFQRFSALPVLGYSEETELQYGAMALFFFKPNSPGGKVHEIDLMAYGSTRGQFQFLIEPHAYFLHDKINASSSFKYQNWVASYFGMGNDVDFDKYVGYDRERLQFEVEVLSSLGLPKALNYGIKAHYENTTSSFDPCKEEDGCLMELPDVHDGWRNGLGYTFTFDTRDNTNWTTSGFFAQWQHMLYSVHLGDYGFDTQSLDLRGYTPLFWNISMATAALWQRSHGDVPFDMLSGPDGTKRFRGVESLYFRDNQAMILQAELRKYLGWRLAGDIFFEGGKVGDHFSELMRNKWHQAVGFGGMLALNLKERLYARGEFSLIDYEKIGMTVYIRSAF